MCQYNCRFLYLQIMLNVRYCINDRSTFFHHYFQIQIFVEDICNIYNEVYHEDLGDFKGTSAFFLRICSNTSMSYTYTDFKMKTGYTKIIFEQLPIHSKMNMVFQMNVSTTSLKTRFGNY